MKRVALHPVHLGRSNYHTNVHARFLTKSLDRDESEGGVAGELDLGGSGGRRKHLKNWLDFGGSKKKHQQLDFE